MGTRRKKRLKFFQLVIAFCAISKLLAEHLADRSRTAGDDRSNVGFQLSSLNLIAFKETFPSTSQRGLVWHITKEIAGTAVYGGVGGVVRELALDQVRRDMSVHVVLPNYRFLNSTILLCRFSYSLLGKPQTGGIYVRFQESIVYVLIDPPTSCKWLWQSDMEVNMFTVPMRCRVWKFDRADRDIHFSYVASRFILLWNRSWNHHSSLSVHSHIRQLFHVHSAHNAPFNMFIKDIFRKIRQDVRIIYTMHDYASEMQTSYSVYKLYAQVSDKRFLNGCCGGVLMVNESQAFSCAVDSHNIFAFNLALCADTITTVSRGMIPLLITPNRAVNSLIERSVADGRVKAIPNWVSTSAWRAARQVVDKHTPSQSKIRAKYALFELAPSSPRFMRKSREETCVVLWLGRFDANKGIGMFAGLHEVVCAAGCFFIVMGYHTTDRRSEAILRAQIRKISKSPSAHSCSFLFVDEKKMQAELGQLARASADMVLVTSFLEAYGLVAAESLAYAAIPIVADVGGLRDIIVPYSSEAENWTGFTFNLHLDNHASTLKEIEHAILTAKSILGTCISRGRYDELLRRLISSTPRGTRSLHEYATLVDRLLLPELSSHA